MVSLGAPRNQFKMHHPPPRGRGGAVKQTSSPQVRSHFQFEKPVFDEPAHVIMGLGVAGDDSPSQGGLPACLIQ